MQREKRGIYRRHREIDRRFVDGGKSGRDFTFSETASRLFPRDLTWAGICLQASSTLFHQDLRENISDFKLKIVVTASFTH